MALIMRHMKFVCDKDAWYRRDEKLWYSGDDKYCDKYNLITEKEAWNEFRNMYDQLCMMANVDDRIVLEQWMEDYKI
jgi:hypothetical protein